MYNYPVVVIHIDIFENDIAFLFVGETVFLKFILAAKRHNLLLQVMVKFRNNFITPNRAFIDDHIFTDPKISWYTCTYN